MKESIIERYNLKRTNDVWGQSLVFGQSVYLWPNGKRGWTILMAECDPGGLPLCTGVYGMYVEQKGETGLWFFTFISEDIIESEDGMLVFIDYLIAQIYPLLK